MSRGRRKNTELEELEAGLGQARDPYMIAELIEREVPDLVSMAHAEIRYTAISMMRAGRIFLAIKAKVGHGKWEDLVEEQKWAWNYVHASVKLIEVAARFPQAVHLPPGTPTKNLLRLPMPQIEEVLGDLPPEAIKKLTVWDIEQVYQQKLKEKKKPPREIEPRTIESSAFDDAYNAAVGALGELAAVEIAPKDFDNIFNLELLHKLGQIYEEVSRHLHPISEIEKRAEIVTGRKN